MPNAGARARKYHGRECFLLLVCAFFIVCLADRRLHTMGQTWGKMAANAGACVHVCVRACVAVLTVEDLGTILGTTQPKNGAVPNSSTSENL